MENVILCDAYVTQVEWITWEWMSSMIVGIYSEDVFKLAYSCWIREISVQNVGFLQDLMTGSNVDSQIDLN